MTRRTLFIKLALSLALLAFFAFRIDFSQVGSMAHNIHFSSWVYALIFMFLQIIALSARWAMLVNIDNKFAPIAFTTSLRINAVSLLANYVLITTLGGIVAKVVLTMSHGVSMIKSITAAIIDRGMTLLALLIMTSLFMPFLLEFMEPPIVSASSLLVIMLLTAISMFVLFILYHNRRKIIFSNRKITVAYKYLVRLFTNPRALAKIIALSLFAQIMYFAAVYVIMKSLGAEFPFYQFMAVIPLITLVSSLPIGYGGWGIREGAFVMGLSLINMPDTAAFMASVQIGLISMLTAAVAGIPAFIDDETQNALKKWRAHRKPRKVYANF